MFGGVYRAIMGEGRGFSVVRPARKSGTQPRVYRAPALAVCARADGGGDCGAATGQAVVRGTVKNAGFRR